MKLIGQNIKNYRILDFIGEGGFGSVYKAEKDGKFYAIKIFREAYVLDEFRRGKDNRITREIEVMQRVIHPNLVSYKEHFFENVLNIPDVFLVMDFIKGETLRTKLIKDTIKNPENIFLKIVEGIEALHNGNIIHRDLKPENIIIDENDDIKILDYGLAKLIDYTSITSTGNILGTFAYMSPEQVTDSKSVDFRSDLYTLGMIFYELLTRTLPYNARLVPEYIDKIKNEPPTPPRKWNRLISNSNENIILKLLEKERYKRYSKISELVFDLKHETYHTSRNYDLTPKFILRTYDEKSILTKYLNDNPERKIFIDFPINHQYRQKGLLEIIQKSNTTVFFDPATIRLAYDTYTDVKGLTELPYCPKDYSVIAPSNLSSWEKQKTYVKLVIDEQIKLKANILISPFHYSHNTNVLPTAKRNPVAEWFDLDVKLLKESLDYRNISDKIKDIPLYAGICINAISLTDSQYKSEILNTYSSISCDGYIVYADGINRECSESILYHYIHTLLELQKYSMKPVIAGRLDTLGLGLICAGITGFTSGAARFESFYEDLYKEASEAYNMYERYYIKDLLSTIAITRKDPIRLQQIVNILGSCNCRYCSNKTVPDRIISLNSKLHFLEVIHDEVDSIIEIDKSERINYFLKRIDLALSKYKVLPMVFTPNDFKYLDRWKNVFNKLKGYNV